MIFDSSTDPLVSIIMPLYNCENFVLDSIKSVIEQTCRNWELIIVDDQSTDNSYTLVSDFIADRSRIQLHQLSVNSGVATARNYAIELAKGSYIAFLDSDDLWLPDKLEKQLRFMDANHSSLSFTAYQRIDESGEISPHVVRVPPSVTYNGLLKETVIACLSAMYDASKIGKFYFETSLKKHEDYQYWLEILKTVDKADGLDIPLAYYRSRNNSLSSNKIAAASYVWKIQREYQKVPFFKALYYFTSYALHSTIKHLTK